MNKRVVHVIIFIWFLGFICCNSADQNPTQHEIGNQYFEDINIFKLEGIRMMSKSNVIYPGIEIDSINESQKKITFWTSDKEKYTREYSWKDNCWQTMFYFQGDTSVLMTYDFILPSKIITFNYTANSDSSRATLFSFSVLKDNVDTLYILKQPVRDEPSINYNKFLNYVFSHRAITRYQLDKDSIKIITKQENFIANSIRIDTANYRIGNHSLFWWQHFGN